MARLNVVGPTHAEGATKELFEAITHKMGKVINIFKGMGNSSAALKGFLGLKGALEEGELTPQEREVIALTMAEVNDCHYCAAAHTVISGMVGLDADETVKIRKGEPSDSKHKALLDFVKATVETKGYVSDAQLQAVKEAGFTDGQIVEIIGQISINVFTNLFNHVNDTAIDFPEPPSIK